MGILDIRTVSCSAEIAGKTDMKPVELSNRELANSSAEALATVQDLYTSVATDSEPGSYSQQNSLRLGMQLHGRFEEVLTRIEEEGIVPAEEMSSGLGIPREGRALLLVAGAADALKRGAISQEAYDWIISQIRTDKVEDSVVFVWSTFTSWLSNSEKVLVSLGSHARGSARRVQTIYDMEGKKLPRIWREMIEILDRYGDDQSEERDTAIWRWLGSKIDRGLIVMNHVPSDNRTGRISFAALLPDIFE